MVTVRLRRNLGSLLHSTGAKKPNEANKTVVLACSKFVSKNYKSLKLPCSIVFIPK